jgi:superfamily II DNA or RNA helicase
MNILLNNSYCELVDFPNDIIEQVKSKLTYANEEAIIQKQMLYNQMHRAKGKAFYAIKARFAALGPDHICLLEDNKFPTGLLHIVKDVVKTTTYKIVDKRSKPEYNNILRWHNKPFELRYFQKEAVEEFLVKGRGVLQMAVGSGKTRCAVEIIKRLAVPTVFVVPSTALLTQAYDIFKLTFGDKNVQSIQTTGIKSGKKLRSIRVVTIQTLASLNKQGMVNSLLGDVDLLILDECHHSGADSFKKLLPAFKDIYYRLGLSGTYLRNDSRTLDLWGVSGEVVYDYNAAKATQEGYLTPVEFNIVRVPGMYKRNYQTEYAENYGGMPFLDAVYETIKNRIPSNNQVLILVDRKEGVGHLINEYLKEKGIKCTYVNGDDHKDDISEAIEDFNNKKIRILLASTILGEGCDIRSTDALIMARGGKSEIAMTQAVGRAVRLYEGKKVAQVYDFNFELCKYLSKHLGIRIETYIKQFAGKVNYL